MGLLLPSLAAQVHTSPIALVPKSQSERWRMIVDLSAPNGASSLTYASVDNAVSIIQHLGQGTQLVKMDLKDAYRFIPVHPQDHHLLGTTRSLSTAAFHLGCGQHRRCLLHLQT